MTIHVHDLGGCAPVPLMRYLKALGILRLVTEQAEPDARAAWRDDRFILVTKLDREALVRFFGEEYRPTPIVAPWNGGSGFYPKDSKAGIDAIASSAAARFADYRRVIAEARALTEGRDESPKDEAKEAMIRACRVRWRAGTLDWLGAAVVLRDGAAPQYPALLGTGGNDGRLDFTNNLMQRLVELIDTESGRLLGDGVAFLQNALFAGPTPRLPRKLAIGQFSPGQAGGDNSTIGFAGESLVNPWDFVLMLEGALVFQVAASRRLDTQDLAQASAPFAVRARASDYATATGADESARGEQWMPLWARPASFAEIRALFAEGRLAAGRHAATAATEAGLALARLGSARGVSAFERYGFIERNGQANLAVPLGRWRVAQRAHQELLDEIEPWVRELRRAAGQREAPRSLGRQVRAIEGTMLSLCREGDSGAGGRWERLLVLLAETEDLLMLHARATSSLRLRPIPPLRRAWFDVVADDSREMRLAIAIATQGHSELGSIRQHAVSVAPRGDRFSPMLGHDPRRVWSGHNVVADLAAVAARRIVEAESKGTKAFPLHGPIGAPLDDIDAFFADDVDVARLGRLSRALMAVRWEGAPPFARGGEPAALHAIFRLAYLPPRSRELVDARRAVDRLVVRLDPRPLHLLLAERLEDAGRAAMERIVAAGARPKIRFIAGSASLARRLAASIAIPVSRGDLDRLLDRVTKKQLEHADA